MSVSPTVSETTIDDRWIAQLPTLIADASQGIAPDHFDGPAEILTSIKTAARHAAARNTAILSRTVDFSMNASDAMAASAKATIVVEGVDNRARDMSAAIEQLTASISQVSTSADNAADVLNRCADLAHQGAEASDQTSQTMSDVSRSVDAASARVDSLAAASRQIGEIVDTIDAIAGQTNLLALNATIEAARAGDAGRGFAVVASEVKLLSNQTAKATDDIRKRIETLRHEVDAILSAMQASSEAVSAGQEACESATESARATANEIMVGTEAVAEIAHVLNEQRAATQELATGVTIVADNASVAEGRMSAVVQSVSQMETVIDAQFAELDTFEIPDYVLYRAKSDHFLWKKNLSAMLAGLNNLKPEELSDHTKCRLGKWHGSVNDPGVRNHPAYAAVERPHAVVHDKGKKAAMFYAAGDTHSAEQAISEMEAASVEVVEQLNLLIARS